MGITAQNVHNVAFSKPPIGKRGYHEEHVDELLDRIEAALTAREKGDPAGLTGADVRAVRFGKPPIGKRGYREDEVDRFLELVVLELDGPTSTAVAPTPAVEPGQTVLFASPATLERVIDMLKAESDLLAQWPAALEARTQPPSLSIYTVG